MAETRTHWNDAEWQLICAELYRVKPIECRSSTMVGIKSQDMFMAMENTLSKDRWRLSMNMSKTRPKLIEHMNVFIQVQDVLKAREEQMAVQDIRNNEDVERKALGPLAKFLAEQMFEYMKPMLDAYLGGKSPNAPADAVQASHRVAETNRKIRVGVIGLLPIQTESLKTQFPQFDMKFVEDGGRSEEIRGLQNMDAIFGLTQKMSVHAEPILKRSPTTWDKYRRVGGKGASAVKRAINLWMQQPVASS